MTTFNSLYSFSVKDVLYIPAPYSVSLCFSMASRELESQCLSIEDTKNVAIAILDAPIFFEGREMVASCYLIGVWMVISEWLFLGSITSLVSAHG